MKIIQISAINTPEGDEVYGLGDDGQLYSWQYVTGETYKWVEN